MVGEEKSLVCHTIDMRKSEIVFGQQIAVTGIVKHDVDNIGIVLTASGCVFRHVIGGCLRVER